jgi:hypothetical protein
LDDINAVREAAVGFPDSVIQFIHHDGSLNAQLGPASGRQRKAFFHRHRLIDVLKVHLVRMGFPLVQNDEVDLAFVLLEDLFRDGNLPPEGGSGEGAEFDDHGSVGRHFHQVEWFVVQGEESEIRRHFSGLRGGLGKLVKAGRLPLHSPRGGEEEEKGEGHAHEETGSWGKTNQGTAGHEFLHLGVG